MLHHSFQKTFKFHLHSALQCPHPWCRTLNLLTSQKILKFNIKYNNIPGAMPCVLLRLSRQSRTQGSKVPEAAAFTGYTLDWCWLTRMNGLKHSALTAIVAHPGDISYSHLAKRSKMPFSSSQLPYSFEFMSFPIGAIVWTWVSYYGVVTLQITFCINVL